MKPGTMIVAIALLAALAMIGGKLYLSDQSFSPANQAWDGTSALSQGMNARMLYSFDGLKEASPDDTLLIIGPSKKYSKAEIGKVADFVAQGGRLVLLDDYGTGNDLLAGMQLPIAINHSPVCQDADYYRRQSFPVITNISGKGLASGLDSLILNHPVSLEVSDRAVVLARTSDRAWLDHDDNSWLNSGDKFGVFPVMATAGYGKGDITVVGDADPLINGMLDKGDNGLLLANILRSGSTVYVDVAHGQTVPPLAGLGLALRYNFAAQAIIVLLTILLVYLLIARDKIAARLLKGRAPPEETMSAKERLLALMRRQPLTDREMRELNKKL